MARPRQWEHRPKLKAVRAPLTQEHLNRQHDLRMWRETLVLVDELNEETTLSKHSLPVIFLEDTQYANKLVRKGKMAWVSMEDVFQDYINPGKAVFATPENVEYHCSTEYIRYIQNKETQGVSDKEAKKKQAYDPDLKEIFENSVIECKAPLTKAKIVSYFDALGVHVPNQFIVLEAEQTKAGEHQIEFMVNDVATAVLQAKVS